MNRTAESKDELTAALAHIETHPDEWDQNIWMCNTSACIGGHAAKLSADVEHIASTYGNVYVTTSRGEIALTSWLWARYPDADSLWVGNNTIEDLRAGVKAYCNDEPVRTAIADERSRRVAQEIERLRETGEDR